jgi:hypothetical protein
MYCTALRLLFKMLLSMSSEVVVEPGELPARLLWTSRPTPESFHLGSVSADKTASVKFTNLTKYPVHVQEIGSSLTCPHSLVHIESY